MIPVYLPPWSVQLEIPFLTFKPQIWPMLVCPWIVRFGDVPRVCIAAVVSKLENSNEVWDAVKQGWGESMSFGSVGWVIVCGDSVHWVIAVSYYTWWRSLSFANIL